MFYLSLRIDPIIVVFSNCKNQANPDWDCGMRNEECGMRKVLAKRLIFLSIRNPQSLPPHALRL
jgi:hypothetical protein